MSILQPTSMRSTEDDNHRPPLLSETYVPHSMPNVLGHRDMFLMYVGALFLLTNAVIGASGGSVSLAYLIIGAVIFFVPCVIAVAQLGILFPHEGALYNWTYHALGASWSFFVGILYWVTGILAVITACDAFVTVLQGLNNGWLPEPWQQGLVIIAIIVVSTVICLQRIRVTQNVMNTIIVTTLVLVVLVALAALVWFAQGHVAQTSFTRPSDWAISPNNFFFFGIITLNFIGTSGTLNMAGEFKGAADNEKQRRSIVTKQLLWGSVCVFGMYFIVSLCVLLVRGQAMANAVVLPFEAFTMIDVTIGKFTGNIASVFFLFYCVFAGIFYMLSSSRVLMAAAIDRRLPSWFGRLNKARAPKNAVIFQMVFSIFVVVIVFMIAPYISFAGGSAATTQAVIYNVFSATTTLVWTLATLFFFINLVFVYRNNRQRFRENRILPMPLLWLSALVGSVACLLTIAGILTYSWIPTLLQNGQWWIYVGGLALAILVVSGIGSIFANSEASWEEIK